MTKTELERHRQQLLDLGKRVHGAMSDTGHEALRQVGGEASGKLSNAPTHPADLATDTFEQETAVSLLENQDHILEEIAAAFQRIEDGAYGKCQECSKDIGAQRLDALPYTPCCVACARHLEAHPA
jgi:RNA polymerase-binding transcription factor DksA